MTGRAWTVCCMCIASVKICGVPKSVRYTVQTTDDREGNGDSTSPTGSRAMSMCSLLSK